MGLVHVKLCGRPSSPILPPSASNLPLDCGLLGVLNTATCRADVVSAHSAARGSDLQMLSSRCP